MTQQQHQRRGRLTRLAAWSAGGAAVAWLMLKAATAASSSAASSGRRQLPPLSLRQEQLRHAQQRFRELFPKVPVVSCQEASSLLQSQPDKYVIVDCRNKEEQEVSMLPGSRVLTAAEYEQRHGAGGGEEHEGATAICYCTVGYRSSQYAAALLDQGRPALNLQGGIIGWTHAGLPLVDGRDRQQASNRVHTYSAKWGEMRGDGYEPVHYTNSRFVMARDVLKLVKSKLFGL